MKTSILKLSEGRSTRLFGANVFFDNSGAVLDVHVKDSYDELILLWQEEMMRVLPVIGWESNYQTGYKKYSKGIRFALSAPFDLLWAATDLVEYLWLSVRHKFELGEFLSLEQAKAHMLPLIDKYTNLEYRKVHAEAHKRSLNVFDDGNKISIGSGKYSTLIPLSELSYDAIVWDKIKEIPSVMVTGTNGKTTTVRLTRFISKMADKVVGYCSSDWIMVGDEVIEKGDLSGPSGNQGVMMNHDVEIAVLEVARGGLLRRGILTNFVKAATVTNISDDHLGEDGVDTVEELAEAKSLVYKAVAPDGYAIVNLDDALMRQKSKELKSKKIYITKDINNPDYGRYLADASYVCYISNDAFYWRDNTTDELVATFADTPITVNGYALHNVENAMNAIALSFSLGHSIKHIGNSLRQYENTSDNNQGRANVFRYNGGRIIVDFAHNVAGINAIVHLAKSYLGDEQSRFCILFGNTGNRAYLVDGIADSIAKSNPDYVVLKEMSNYLRGTEPGFLVRLMQEALIKRGIKSKDITLVDNELAALDVALEFVKPGDVFLFISHESAEEVIAKLKAIEDK